MNMVFIESRDLVIDRQAACSLTNPIPQYRVSRSILLPWILTLSLPDLAGQSLNRSSNEAFRLVLPD